MKALRSMLAVLLVLIIVGGLGYLGYTYLFMGNMNHGNVSSGQTAAPGSMSGMQGMQDQNTSVPNLLAAQNRDKLNQAMTLVNQAMDLITIDPYSKTTVPYQNSNPSMGQVQPNQGSGTINIYPGGNSSVTILPNNNGDFVVSATPPAMGSNVPANAAPQYNYVYDQNQLRQLHNDIYALAQGIMVANQLQDDLLIQSSLTEPSTPDYQTYVARYNMALQNKAKLNNAMTLLNSMSTLVNSNPYAPQSGYQFKSGEMDKLHEGVYKMAQAMIILSSLNDDFTRQMTNAAVGAQNISYNPHANMTGTTSIISLPLIINIVLIVLLVGLIAGVIGAIMRMARRNHDPGTVNTPNTV